MIEARRCILLCQSITQFVSCRKYLLYDQLTASAENVYIVSDFSTSILILIEALSRLLVCFLARFSTSEIEGPQHFAVLSQNSA